MGKSENQVLGKGSMRIFVCYHDDVALLLKKAIRNVVTSCLFFVGHICMFLTSLAAFQMMNVNPCISTVSVAAAEERERKSGAGKQKSVFSFLWDGRAKFCFCICLLHHEASLPSVKDVVGKGVPGFLPAGERRKNKPQTDELCWLWSPVGVGGSSVQGCVLLSIPVCRSSWYRLLARHQETPR